MEVQKKLNRVEEGKVFTGVCKGLAEYFNMDVQLVRIIYVISTLLWGLPLIIYIVLSFALPVKEHEILKAETLEDEYAYNEDDYKL